MTTFGPIIIQNQGPLFSYPMTCLQGALYKYMRPLDIPVAVYVNSDDTVNTDYAVPILATPENGEVTTSNVGLLQPWYPASSPIVGPPEGAEGGPYGTPPPYATISDATSGTLVLTNFVLNPYPKYWFRGGLAYPNISANLIAILTAAGYAEYLH